VAGRIRTVIRLCRWFLFPESRPVQPLHWGDRLFRSIRAYRPAHFPDRVDVFYSTDIPPERLQVIRGRWEGQGIRDLRWASVPGNHVTIWEEPNVVTLARRLRESLDDARAVGPRAVAGDGAAGR
jgi:thioesterase domain-containing protein